MSREKTPPKAVSLEAEAPSREEQRSIKRPPLGVSMTPTTGTGPHRPRTGAHAATGYAFLSNARSPAPRRDGKRRMLIIVGAVVLLGAQGAAAVYLVKSKGPAKDKIEPGSAQAGISKESDRPDAAKLYREAKELFAAGNRYGAIERLKRMQMVTKDEEILSLAGALERRIEAATEMDQAQIQIKSGKWKEAAFHLQKVLSLDPSDQAKRLFKEANDKLGVASAVPTPEPPKPVAEPKPAGKPGKKPYKGGSGKTPVKVAVVTPKKVDTKPEPKIEPKPEPKPEPKKVEPKPEPKPEPKKVEPKPEPKKVEPKPAQKEIPHLALPKRAVVKVTNDDGTRSKQLSVVCRAVEMVVAKATGKPTNGLTGAFANHVYDKFKGNKGQSVTVFPQDMGKLVAETVLRDKPGLTARLIENGWKE